MISLLSFTLVLTLTTESTIAMRSRSTSKNLEPGPIICRMTMLGTLYEKGWQDDGLPSDKQSACAPIENGRETDYLIPLQLPIEIEQAHKIELGEGSLFVEISNARLIRGEILLTPSSQFSSMKVSESSRHLEQRQLLSSGEMTIAFVRIITSDGKSPSATSTDIEALMTEDQVNMHTQFNKCSYGKLRFKKANRFVTDVTLDKAASSFFTGTDIADAAQEKLLQLYGDLNQASDLADRVIFCAPPGTGKWVASAGKNHWRAQFNDGFCTSLSALMHEIGHTIGLPHTGENGDIYGDCTGYMSSSYKAISKWPQRCFNGYNSHFLGWYAEKEMSLNGNENPQLIELAGIVDYNKASTVLVNIQNRLFLQYNRAKDFNVDTGEWRDSLLVTEDVQGESELRAGLSPGEVYTSSDYVVEACKRVNGDDIKPDTMIISVGKGRSLCADIESLPLVVTPASNSYNQVTHSGSNIAAQETSYPTVAIARSTPIAVPVAAREASAPIFAPTNTIGPISGPTVPAFSNSSKNGASLVTRLLILMGACLLL
jgi:hypothetical protein